MPKYKLLRGVAHNLGDSFLSLMNHFKYDYCLDYLYAVSRVKKIDMVKIDFLECKLAPKYFDLRELICSIYNYRRELYTRIIELGMSPVEIESVIMSIRFDDKRKKITKSHKIRGKTFSEVSIRLKNGKEYKNTFNIHWPLDSDKNYNNLYNKITK